MSRREQLTTLLRRRLVEIPFRGIKQNLYVHSWFSCFVTGTDFVVKARKKNVVEIDSRWVSSLRPVFDFPLKEFFRPEVPYLIFLACLLIYSTGKDLDEVFVAVNQNTF